MEEQELKRGDLVEYEGKHYYFQPNGTSCYLYERLEDVGNKDKKVRSPAKKSVRKAAVPLPAASSHPAARKKLPLTSDLNASDIEMQAAPVTGGGSEPSEVSSPICTEISTLLSDSSTHEPATEADSVDDDDSAGTLEEALDKVGLREVHVVSGFDPATLPRDPRFKLIRELYAICHGGGPGKEAAAALLSARAADLEAHVAQFRLAHLGLMQCERAGANVSDATWRVNLFEPLLRLVFRSHLLLSMEPVSVPIGKLGQVWRPDLMVGPPLLSAPVLPALVSAIVDCTSSEEPLRRLRRVMLLQHTQLAKQLNWWAGARTHTPLAPLGESCCVGVHMDRHGVSFSCVSPSPESDGARLCYVMSPVAWTEPNLAKVVAVLAVVADASASFWSAVAAVTARDVSQSPPSLSAPAAPSPSAPPPSSEPSAATPAVSQPPPTAAAPAPAPSSVPLTSLPVSAASAARAPPVEDAHAEPCTIV